MKLYVWIAALVLFSFCTVQGMDIHVPGDYPTISDAISAAANGDKIIVWPKTYHETINLDKNITVVSKEGPESTIIDGARSGSVVTFAEGNESWLIGFTLTNGYAEKGGGVFCYRASPSIVDCIIKNNGVSSYGGGVCSYSEDSSAESKPLLVNNYIYYNHSANLGGGICCEHYGSVDLRNCTVVNNTAINEGGGIYSGSQDNTDISNSILWDNNPEEIANQGPPPIVSYSDIMGGYTGNNNINSDPEFVNASTNDYHLTYDSPCRNAGSNTYFLPDVTLDPEGDPRIALSTIDMGADEYYFHLYLTGDVQPGQEIDVNVVGWPTAPVNLYMDPELVDPPLSTQYGDFYLPWPTLWDGSLGQIPQNGVLTLTVTVPSTWKPGDTYYLQALVGPWGSFFTTLTNYVKVEILEDYDLIDAHWTFHEMSGTVLHDVSGEGWHGTLNGDPQWVPGPSGGVLEFNGVDDWVGTNLVPIYDGDDSYTWEVIARYSAPVSVRQAIMGFEKTQSAEVVISHTDSPPGHASGHSRCDNYGVNGGGHVIKSLNPINDGGWHHLALVRDREFKKYRFYVDHVLQLEIDDNNNNTPINQDGQLAFSIGCENWNGNDWLHFAGAISEIRLASTALEPSQFIPFTNLIDAHYTFDEMSGNTLHDVSGNGWHGTLHGNPQWVAGNSGGALEFDGSSDWVGTNLVPIYYENDSYTWEVIARYSAPVSVRQAIMGFEKTQSAEVVISHTDSPAGYASGHSRCDNYVNGHVLKSLNPLDDGSWHHFALVRDRERVEYRFYVDHVLQETTPDINGSTPINLDGQLSFSIGCENWNGNDWLHFTGAIDEIRLASTALEPDSFLSL